MPGVDSHPDRRGTGCARWRGRVGRRSRGRRAPPGGEGRCRGPGAHRRSRRTSPGSPRWILAALDGGRGMRLGIPEAARSDGRVTAFPAAWPGRLAGEADDAAWRGFAGALVAALLALWIAFASPISLCTRCASPAARSWSARSPRRVTASAVGVPVLRVDTGSLEAQIEADSRAADATVRRGLPRSLVVEVVARAGPGRGKAKGQVDLADIQGVVAERVT